MEQNRTCRICGENKNVSDFYPTYAKGGGLRRVCGYENVHGRLLQAMLKGGEE